MRKADDPGYKVDWTNFAGVNRQKIQEESMGKIVEDEFDTTIHGPWMKRLEVYIRWECSDQTYTFAELYMHYYIRQYVPIMNITTPTHGHAHNYAEMLQ